MDSHKNKLIIHVCVRFYLANSSWYWINRWLCPSERRWETAVNFVHFLLPQTHTCMNTDLTHHSAPLQPSCRTSVNTTRKIKPNAIQSRAQPDCKRGGLDKYEEWSSCHFRGDNQTPINLLADKSQQHRPLRKTTRSLWLKHVAVKKKSHLPSYRNCIILWS